MKSISWLACVAAASALCVSVSCSSSDKSTDDGSSGSGADAGSGASSGKGNSEGGAPSEAGTGNAEAGATTGEAGTANGATGEAGSGNGTLPAAPKPILCPEIDPIHPKLANSVSVQGVTLKTDTHWTSDKVYLIQDDFKVEGHTLTIDAGTVICLTHDAKIYVGEGVDPGEIHINGTANKHVVITGFPNADDTTKVDAFHGGIKLDTYQDSSISYLDVWYGGPGGGGAAYAFELDDTAQGTDKVTPLLVDHVTIGAVQAKGFRVGTPNGVAESSQITFTGFAPHRSGDPAYDVVTELNWYAEKSVANALTLYKEEIPAAVQRARLTTTAPPLYINHDTEITNFGLPYWYTDGKLIVAGPDEGTSATLTIDAGVTIHMGKQLQVGEKHQGDLIINGTADNPVTLTSAEDTPGPGDWEGIIFQGGNGFYSPTKSQIKYLNIEYAGLSGLDISGIHVASCNHDITGAIQVGSPNPGVGETFDGPSITHTNVSHSQTYGIATDLGGTYGTVSNDYAASNTFTDCKEGDVSPTICAP